LGENAKKEITNKFELEKIVQKITTFYKSI